MAVTFAAASCAEAPSRDPRVNCVPIPACGPGGEAEQLNVPIAPVRKQDSDLYGAAGYLAWAREGSASCPIHLPIPGGARPPGTANGEETTSTVGVSFVDSYGRKILVADGPCRVCSAGPDGRWNNADDVRVLVPHDPCGEDEFCDPPWVRFGGPAKYGKPAPSASTSHFPPSGDAGDGGPRE